MPLKDLGKAVLAGDLGLVKALIADGLDIDEPQDEYGSDARRIAIQEGQQHIIDRFHKFDKFENQQQLLAFLCTPAIEGLRETSAKKAPTLLALPPVLGIRSILAN